MPYYCKKKPIYTHTIIIIIELITLDKNHDFYHL